MEIKWLFALLLSSTALFPSAQPSGGDFSSILRRGQEEDPINMADMAAAIDEIADSQAALDRAKQIIKEIIECGKTPSLEAFLQFSSKLESFCTQSGTNPIFKNTILTYGNEIMHALLGLIMHPYIDDQCVLSTSLCGIYTIQQLSLRDSFGHSFALDRPQLDNLYPIVKKNVKKLQILEAIISFME